MYLIEDNNRVIKTWSKNDYLPDGCGGGLFVGTGGFPKEFENNVTLIPLLTSSLQLLKGADEYILMVLFVLLLERVNFLVNQT